MNAKEATRLFNKANRHYTDGAYSDALDILEQLNQRYPNRFPILHLMVLCHENAGDLDTAHTRCVAMLSKPWPMRERDTLLKSFNRIRRAADEPLPPPPTEITPYVAPMGEQHVELNAAGMMVVGKHWFDWRILAAGLLVIILVVAGIMTSTIVLARLPEVGTEQQEILFFGMHALRLYLINAVVLYLLLWSFGEMLHQSFLHDIVEALLGPALIMMHLASLERPYLYNAYSFREHYNLTYGTSLLIFIVILLVNGTYFYLVMSG